ncbi:MAG TPA: toll/interleukin-1 receptor domain-containing protein [Allosphingosinicella sp.]|nr:toll/interleukin-1 receptor domain-containing protein [Allosphingosinicella sp.]
MGEEQAPDELRYTAFLSYSHRDAAAALRLHRRLEAYRMPKRLVGRETARGPVPGRLAPIFRDREELPAATDLSETVRAALAQSGALIVLCSPNSAGSLWVAEEVKTFRELHPDRPILAAVLDGDPPDCFPAALRAFGRDGTWHEPLATDLRPQRDGMRLGVLKLVAGITGVGLDALVQRDAARRVRRVTAVTVGALIALLITAALALVALQARREADRQRAEAEGLIEFMLTDLRTRLKGVGRIEIMAAVNQRALAYYGGQDRLKDLGADSLEQRARVLLAMGEDYSNRGNLAAALAAFREAHRTTAEQLARAPNDANRMFAHSQSEFWLGRVDYDRHDFAAARRAFDRYKALTDRLLAANAADPHWIREAAYAEGNLCAIALAAPVDAPAALRACATALERMERARRLMGPDPAVIVDLTNRHAWMAKAWHANGHWDRALVHMSRHEALVRALVASDPDNNDYREIRIGGQIGFAELELDHGEREAARSRLASAAPDLAALRRLDPSNATWRSLERRMERALARGERGEGR